MISAPPVCFRCKAVLSDGHGFRHAYRNLSGGTYYEFLCAGCHLSPFRRYRAVIIFAVLALLIVLAIILA